MRSNTSYWIRYGWSAHVLIERKQKDIRIILGKRNRENRPYRCKSCILFQHETKDRKLCNKGGRAVSYEKKFSAFHRHPPLPIAGYNCMPYIDSYSFHQKQPKLSSKGKVLLPHLVYIYKYIQFMVWEMRRSIVVVVEAMQTPVDSRRLMTGPDHIALANVLPSRIVPNSSFILKKKKCIYILYSLYIIRVAIILPKTFSPVIFFIFI